MCFLQPLAARMLQPGRRAVEILDLEAEVMDAAEVGAVRTDVGGFLGLPIQHREIDVSVGQKYRTVRRTPDLLHTEGLLVEGGGLSWIFCRERDVLDPGHGFLPLR